MPFPTMTSDDIIENMTLFKNFSGLVGTCIIFKSEISGKIKDIIKEFPCGLASRTLCNLFDSANKTSDNITNSLISDSYIIFSPFYSSNKGKLYNVNSSINITGNFLGVYGITKDKFIYIDSAKNMLPFFQISCTFRIQIRLFDRNTMQRVHGIAFRNINSIHF